MIESIDIILMTGGLTTGIISTLLLMRTRMKRIREQAQADSEAARQTAAGLLSAKEEQIEQVRAELKVAVSKIEKLNEQLRCEISNRAAAEGRNCRIPEIEAALQAANGAREQLLADNTGLQTRLAELETRILEERKHAEEKLALLNDAGERLKLEFRNLADRIFEDKSQKFTDQNRASLDSVLTPVRDQLREFKKKIEDVYDKESKERVSLFHEIVHLKALNQKISEDAVNLTNALKGQSKTQGAWGELILERILEESGLHKGREYEPQATFADEAGGRFRPDVIVHLPEGRDVIIDSKVSLTAYERYCAATTEVKRQQRLREHLISVRTHIKGLSEKRYEELTGVRSLDFVLMFLPVEGAFWIVMENDPSLFNDAFAKNIMLVGPSTLLATLRIIQNIWRHEDQHRNALLIAKKAGDLYDKFAGFVDSLEDIGQKIGKAREAYDRAHSQLASGKGNLIRRAEELKTLGVVSKKSLPASLAGQAEAGE